MYTIIHTNNNKNTIIIIILSSEAYTLHLSINIVLLNFNDNTANAMQINIRFKL